MIVDLTLRDLNGLLAGMSDTDIRSDAARLHERLKKLVTDVPDIQSVWVYGRDGRALATSTVHPPPQTERYSDRDYFAAHVDADPGIYYGQVQDERSDGDGVESLSDFTIWLEEVFQDVDSVLFRGQREDWPLLPKIARMRLTENHIIY